MYLFRCPGIAAGFLLVVALAATYAVSRYTDFVPGLRDSHAQLENAFHKSAELDAAQETLFGCMQAKEDIARNLLAGRLSAAEAFARFQVVDEARPLWLVNDLHGLAGASLEERYVTCLLVYVADLLQDQPNREERLAQLTAELLTTVPK